MSGLLCKACETYVATLIARPCGHFVCNRCALEGECSACNRDAPTCVRAHACATGGQA